MATIANPHWEATPPDTRGLLETIASFPFANRFYLAGGTALALCVGHRMSQDLDFFSEFDSVEDASRAEIRRHLDDVFAAVSPITDVRGDLTVSVSSRRVGFYSYGYKLLETVDQLVGISVASLVDIAAMKLDAIAGRGARRDFYDLYFLAHQYPLEELLERSQAKYPYARDFPMMIVPYLNDFRNADRDAPIEALRPVTWEQVREFFLSETRRLSELWHLPPKEHE